VLAGCGAKRTTRSSAPPPPAPSSTSSAKISVPKDAKPIYIETGLASWYGGPYHNRRAADGSVYDMHAPTAAHRTLPLNTIVRVTNLETRRSTLVRITDRGPFVDRRIIDLSMAAAKEVDVYRAGVAPVKVEVLQTPSPLFQGGRWAVQIGAFDDEDRAVKLKNNLTRRYPDSRVLAFVSPVGKWWVRVRVPDDDRKQAQQIARSTTPSQGQTFLVRLD
jgi:rare lipoprotein A